MGAPGFVASVVMHAGKVMRWLGRLGQVMWVSVRTRWRRGGGGFTIQSSDGCSLAKCCGSHGGGMMVVVWGVRVKYNNAGEVVWAWCGEIPLGVCG